MCQSKNKRTQSDILEEVFSFGSKEGNKGMCGLDDH